MRRIHLCNHFHCDPIFTCPQSVHIAESVELARQFVGVVAEDPEFTCILSEIDYLQGWWNTYPELRTDFLRYLRENRIETSGSYSEPNENSVGGEALLRNIVYGQWWLVDYLGGRGNVYMPFDVFGHVRQLPQILHRLGFIGTAWSKGSPKHGRGNQELAWWLAPDGSRLLNRVVSYGGVDWGANDQLDGLAPLAKRTLADRMHDQPGGSLLFRGSDFVSPPGWIVGNVDKIRSMGYEVSQPSRYFNDALDEIAERGINPPVTGREMSLYHAGTALSRVELKIGTRLAEQAVLEAETLATIATLFGKTYPEAKLDHAWRQILFSQHHDSITGTSNDQSYLDLMAHLREALAFGVEARSDAAKTLVSRVQTDKHDGVPVVVFNSLNIPRTDTVRVDAPDVDTSAWEAFDETGDVVAADTVDTPAGRKVQFVADGVPGVGHRTYWLRPANAVKHAVDVSDDQPVVVETEHVRAVFDPWRGGGITSLVEKTTGRDVVRPDSDNPLGDLVCLKEGPGPEPSWEYQTTGECLYGNTVRATVERERTPLGWRVSVRHEFPDTDGVVRKYEFFDDTPRIDCTVTLLDYSGSRLLGRDRQNRRDETPEQHQATDPENRDLFGLLFPVGMTGVAPRWSDRFGSRVIRRSTNYLDFRTHQSRFYSGSGLYSAEQWIAATPDVTIVVDDGSQDLRGIVLGMVRVVHPDRPHLRAASDRLIASLACRGITATPYLDTENQDDDPLQTDQIIAIGGPEENAWVASHPEFAESHAARSVHDVAPFGEGGKTVPVLVVRGGRGVAQDCAVSIEVDRIVQELASDRIYVPASAMCSAAGELLAPLGFAVLNRGTIAASCEPDGSLFLALHHAAGWCDWATPFYLGHPFVPERKSSVYHYAIMPFAGTWSDARLPEHAAQYNRPMPALLAEQHGGDLPSTHQYFAIDADGSLLSALKPTGHTSVAHDGMVMTADRGTVVRLWNWDRSERSVGVGAWTGLRNVRLCDPAERPGADIEIVDGRAEFSLGANAIETVEITPALAESGTAATENEMLPTRAVQSRWWLENAGAAPIGNMPVSVALRGDILPGELGTVQVAVANNRSSEQFMGEVLLTGPDGWAIEPSMIPVDLDPLGGAVVDVLVEAPPESAGRLTASLADGVLTYFDILEIGEVADPVVLVDIDAEQITARVENSTADRMHFVATLITPIETWYEANAIIDGMADWPVAFRDRHFSLDPGAAEEIVIPIPSDFSQHAWAFLKVAYAGRARYHRVPVHLIAEKQSYPGAPIALRTPTADATLTATTGSDSEETTLRAEITRRTTSPNGCKASPLDGIAKYWTIGVLDGSDAIESVELSVGVVPAEMGVARSPRAVQLARWNGDTWVPVPTTFDERTWELRTQVAPEALREPSHWTIVGETDVIWRTRVDGRFFESNPYVGDIDGDGSPEIVVGTAWNEIVLLNATGDICWRRRFTGWAWPSPRFGCADIDHDGRQEIVVCTSDRTLALLDADGRVRWRRDDQPFSKKSAPVFGDINGDGRDEIIVSINEYGVWAWTADGESVWRTKLSTALLSAPTFADTEHGSAVFVSVAGKRLVRIDGNGEVVWERVFADGAALERYAASPVVTTTLRDRQSVVFAGHDGVLRLVDLDGEQVWQVDIGRPIVSAPVIVSANGDGAQVLCVASDGRMVWVSPDGALVREHHLHAPVQGAIVFADVDGDGVDEIVIGTSRTLQTVVMKQDGTEVARVPYGAIWEHAAAVESLTDDARSAIIVGSVDEYLVATVPTLSAE